MAKHSSTPWQIHDDYTLEGQTTIIANVDGESFTDGTHSYTFDFVCDTYGDGDDDSRSPEIAKANAAFIVKACNAHGELVSLAREAIELIQQSRDELFDSHQVKGVLMVEDEADKAAEEAIAEMDGWLSRARAAAGKAGA